VVFFGALSFLVARIIGTTQLYQLAYALAGLLLVAFVLGFFFSRGLVYARRVPAGERFVAGRTFHVELMVSNASPRRSPGVEVVDRLPQGRRQIGVPPVEGPGKRVIREPVLFAKRGLYELGPAEIRTTDPFGFLRFARKFEACTEVVVYPEVFEFEDLPLQGRGRETGVRDSLARRPGDEFSGLREYRQGDDQRHIHWKSVARTGELIVKEFIHNAPRRYAVVLDLHCRPDIHVPEAEVEDAVSAAGSILKYLFQEGLPFRLLCVDKGRHEIAFGNDEAAYWRAMDLLATARADGDADMGDYLAEKLHEEREGIGEGVILVSRSLGDGLVKTVQEFRAAGLSVIVVAFAAYTYRTGSASSSGREAAFSENIRRLELAGAEVCTVRRQGGVAAFAGGEQPRAAGAQGTM
jgi:uncharacterized protein (DUF58 family)